MTNELTSTAQENIVQTALAAGKKLTQAPITSPLEDGVPFIVLRDKDGKESCEYLTERFSVPYRKKGTVKLFDEASFVNFWDRHNSLDTTLFSSPLRNKFTAIFNDHGEKKDPPGWRDHRAEYMLKHSEEWLAWTTRDKKPFEGNLEFAEFVENMLPDFVEPEGASMLELILNLKVTANASYAKAVRLSDGDTQFTYTNSVEGTGQANTGQIKIPEQFIISIPIFDGVGSPKYDVAARFRYRLQNASLRIWYELIRPSKIVDEAFYLIVSRIAKKTSSDIYFGSPE